MIKIGYAYPHSPVGGRDGAFIIEQGERITHKRATLREAIATALGLPHEQWACGHRDIKLNFGQPERVPAWARELGIQHIRD